MAPFATTEDLSLLWRNLTAEELSRADAILPTVSDILRQEALNVGRNLDEMIQQGKVLSSVVKSVTVDITARVLMTPRDETPMTQVSQSALGYTVSGSYLIPGGGIFVKKSELARLGLRRQRIGVIELYEAQGNRCDPPGEDADRD